MKIIILNSSKLPIYEQIINSIKDEIVKGSLKEGEKLPSIRSLAKELNISVITTKRAYDELEREGFISTVAGKGCYVSYFNKELIHEQKLKEVEEHLEKAVDIAKSIGLTRDDINEILNLIYEG